MIRCSQVEKLQNMLGQGNRKRELTKLTQWRWKEQGSKSKTKKLRTNLKDRDSNIRSENITEGRHRSTEYLPSNTSLSNSLDCNEEVKG